MRLVTRLVTERRAAGVTGRPVRVLNVMGMRAQESPARARMRSFYKDERASNGRRTVDVWLPIHGWTLDEVWADIRGSGVPYHPVYDAGMPRLSCRFCVLASASALVLAAQLDPEGAAKRAAVEMLFAWRRATRVAAVTIAAANGTLTPAFGARLAKRVLPAGPLFQQGRSMASIIAKAQAAGAPARVEDWAA
jgi:3'-phosphoadenosine 5'-phosphosulfate sulfotransferase (PAPS reductase)/FAD synthetase